MQLPNLLPHALKKLSLNGKDGLWTELIGGAEGFTLERRIFHSISIGLICLAAIYVPYNFYAGLYVGSLSALIMSLLFAYQYYHSRFHGRQHSNLLFGFTGVLIFGVNYFTNSGIDGSTDLIWPVYLLLVLSISPYKQHMRWVVIYLVSFFILHWVEFVYPYLIKHPFVAGKGQFIDRTTAFPLTVVSLYIIINYIRKSHDKERRAAEEKTIAIERNNEQILLQKHQLEQSNSEKNKLMSIISHDLRTPLINIQNYLELLNEGRVDEEDRLLLEKALLKSTNNAVEMLSNLLHWSKSQMEGPSVRLLAINLHDTLLSTLEMEKLHAAKKGIELSYAIASELMVVADVDMLQLVIRNLISNAVKFTPSGGQISITAYMEANECKITVKDTGNGIPPHIHERIFSIKSEPAYGTHNEKGVGLGLVLCKEFTERQGGRIGFESEMGVGSSFFIFVPQQTA